MDYTVTIEATLKKTANNVYCNIHHKLKYNKSELGLSTKSVATFHKCGKREIKKGISNPIEIFLIGNYARYKQKSFQNGSTRSLLCQM